MTDTPTWNPAPPTTTTRCACGCACRNLIFDTTLPRFDLMAQLQRAPKGMKMGELSRHMMVTNGNITGITDQLERKAWWSAPRSNPTAAAR